MQVFYNNQNMFSNLISSKLEKYTNLDISRYLNQNKKQSNVPPSKKATENIQSVNSNANPNLPPSQLTQQPSQSIPQSLSQTQSQANFKKNDFQLKIVTIQGLPPLSTIPPKLQKPEGSITLQVLKKLINIHYYQGQTKFRLQISSDSLFKPNEMNQGNGSIIISTRRIVKYRIEVVKGTNQNLLTQDAKQLSVGLSLILKEKDAIMKSVGGRKSLNDKLIEEEFIFKEGNKNGVIEGEHNAENRQPQEQVESIKFIPPTQVQIAQTEKFRKTLKEMKEQDKVTILTEVFKIKKEYEDPLSMAGERKKLKCPIFSCQKVYREVGLLKTHMKKHPQLSRHGIQLTQYGVFQYSPKALELALIIGKIYPQEMKKIVKKMKTKQPTE